MTPLNQVNCKDNQIDVQKIREECSLGLNIYCQPEERAIAWLILLSIYPTNHSHWKIVLERTLKTYRNFSNFFADLDQTKPNSNDIEKMFSSGIIEKSDKGLLNCIRCDVNRSIPQLLYFINKEGNNCRTDYERKKLQIHIHRIEKILFIFAKVNPQLGYIQGFNELIIPLYFVLYSAHNLFFNRIDYLEAILYRAFEFLLISSDLKDFFNLEFTFCKSKMDKFDRLLNLNLPKFSKEMRSLKIDSIQYAFKWFNVIFAQEHPLPQLLPLWDSIFAHWKNVSSFEFCVGVARIQAIQNKIEVYYPRNKQKLVDNQILKVNGINYEINPTYGEILSILDDIKIRDIYGIIKQANKIYASLETTNKRCIFSLKK
ncbi:hypothetical protein M9Y10_013610 [Tritrichomonas musculus]|uniref:Rab-GAP TBC domain-containing protein n=1 Tax=Tritrichomonas musculus TaxID=1915356 RepID=A0ABR2KYC7_9EUKA